MFKELAALAQSTSIHVIITAAGSEELKVVVLPQSREGLNPALCQPLILTATPEELDEKFTSILTEYKAARKSLEETLEAAKLVMEAAGKSAQTATSKATQKASSQKTAAPAVADKTNESPDKEPLDTVDSASGGDEDIDLFG